MKISFWLTSTTREMSEDNWGKVPMGGAEISALNLGDELLRLRYKTVYYLQRCKPFRRGNLSVEKYSAVTDDGSDYFICVRPHPVLRERFKRKILWSGDAYDQPSNDIFCDPEITRSMYAFVFKSHWQKTKILEKFPYIQPEKAFVIYNGIEAERFAYLSQAPIPHRFIHASIWYRGVFNFIDIWPRILEKYPDAEIHVFSKNTLYSERDSGDQRWKAIAEELCKLPGMVLREPVPQWILAQEMRKAWLMLYPNTGFVESSCGAALQSLAAGTPVIATKRAGLIETVGDCGHLVEEAPGWQNQFVEKTIELCENKNRRNLLGKLAREAVLQQSWNQQAKKWVQFLRSRSL